MCRELNQYFTYIIALFLIIEEARCFSLKSSLQTCNEQNAETFDCGGQRRRQFLGKMLSVASLPFGSDPVYAVERAVGSSEKNCRENGNCLENFELDGAVGWNWGGKDRCDASDPRCGPDGTLAEMPPVGQPIPEQLDEFGNELKVTELIKIEISIGKSEKGTLTLGLYGDSCPNSVAQMLEFFSENVYSGGILTTSKLMLEDGLGVETTPVSFLKGGNLQTIYPQKKLEFGVASQSLAYARMKRMNKVPENFIPQPRPNNQNIVDEKSSRKHTSAGLLSIPTGGIGYGGSGLENVDEAFANAFEITADAVPSLDKEGRKVIGQLMDIESMNFLSRLAYLPTQKGLLGVVPGKNYGPPLVKVSVSSISTLPPTLN